MTRKHWSEQLSCICGKRFRNMTAEAVHRHNFPAYCNKKKLARKLEEIETERAVREGNHGA